MAGHRVPIPVINNKYFFAGAFLPMARISH
jgi:hypothetical protein